MNKIYIIKITPRDFIKLVGDKKTTGYAYFEISNKTHKIFIKNIRNKFIKKRTIEHELSHIILRTLRLRNKINKVEFKKVLKDKNFRDYEKDIYNTSFKLHEEFLTDLISYILFGNKNEKDYIKGKYPKNYKIINNLTKGFKPNITYI